MWDFLSGPFSKGGEGCGERQAQLYQSGTVNTSFVTGAALLLGLAGAESTMGEKFFRAPA